MKLDSDDVMKRAIDIVSAIASNPSNHLIPSQETANDIADFVETLVARMGNSSNKD